MVEPNGLAVDPAQKRLYIADVADHRVRVVDLASGAISTFAGTGEPQHSGDGGPASAAGIYGARAVKVAADRTVYILERQGSTLRAVDPHSGIITTCRYRREGLWRRRRAGPRRFLQRAKGTGDRPRGQPLDRRYRKPRDPPASTSAPEQSPRSPVAAGKAATATADRPAPLRSTGRMAQRSPPTARSISATPTTTASAKSRQPEGRRPAPASMFVSSGTMNHHERPAGRNAGDEML